MTVDESPPDDGIGAPRSSYNFAPGYHGIVYRAETRDRSAGPRCTDSRVLDDNLDQSSSKHESTVYKLQTMRWGLIPSWTKRNPDYGTMMKTINCRDDSLSTPGGMWASMKTRKRCLVIAQGFYEWLKTSSKDKLPHHVRRNDGKLMCFAGLWDCVQLQDSDDKTYTYTVITTDSNEQMKFLHDRMPVILEPGSDEMRTWLDPKRNEWSRDLQSLLKPFRGDLDIYPVSKDVGKVGNNSPSFVVPLNSAENKSNIANFFDNATKSAKAKDSTASTKVAAVSAKERSKDAKLVKRKDPDFDPSISATTKKAKTAATSSPSKSATTISATSNKMNASTSPSRPKSGSSKKITSFFQPKD